MKDFSYTIWTAFLAKSSLQIKLQMEKLERCLKIK